MKKGYGIFGKPYEIMLKNDLHDTASVDHELMRNMILLDEESVQFLYETPHAADMRSHELYQFAQQFRTSEDKKSIRNVLDFTSSIAEQYQTDFRDMYFGGTEKQILERKTDWCADMARLGTVLLQSMGIPCRIIHLADLNRAFHGHAAGEAYYEGFYGVVDFIYGYMLYTNRPISARDIIFNHTFPDGLPESYRRLYSAVGISEYDPLDPENDYTISKPNDYYLKLIYADHRDRWIMGEDEVEC
ncbi:MAG: transglutaminase-like domain-containing protein [Solobacterium sp.]|nr:transglutaminase-like domain-containing protein [Solobacterium sp.]